MPTMRHAFSLGMGLVALGVGNLADTANSACECGYIPAGLYTITKFYKRDETSKRFSVFFLGSMVANAAGGVIAYGM